MTVKELIQELQKMPQEAVIYAEGEPAGKVLYENADGNSPLVRIFKPWDVDFVTGYDLIKGTYNE